MIFLSYFFISWRFLTKKLTSFTNMSLQFSINSSKYIHFWTLVLKTILILIKFPLQRYISCRHLNFYSTYQNGCHGDFPPFWKLGILGLVDHFVVCSKIFLEVITPCKKVKVEFSLDSKIFTGLCYSAWTIWKHFRKNRNIFEYILGSYLLKRLCTSELDKHLYKMYSLFGQV